MIEVQKCEPASSQKAFGHCQSGIHRAGTRRCCRRIFWRRGRISKNRGDAFIALLQITVIPYVVVALITSIGRLTLDDVKRLAIRGGSILSVLWAIGLVVIFLTPLALPDWPSASFFSISEVEEAKSVDFLKLYIPSNIFFALSNAVVPAIVVFSILFGVALIQVKQKRHILDLLSTVGDVLMTITGFVGKLAPYGVFALIASAAGTIELADLGRLQVYLVIYITLALILSIWLIPALIATLTPLSYREILRTFRGPLVTAFATGSVLIVLPVLASDSRRLIEEADRHPEQPEGQAESSVDILVSAAYPFPSLGGLLALWFVLFGGWYIGSMVPAEQYPTLAIAGIASLFGGTVLALPFLLTCCACRRICSRCSSPSMSSADASARWFRPSTSSLSPWSGLTLCKVASPCARFRCFASPRCQ